MGGPEREPPAPPTPTDDYPGGVAELLAEIDHRAEGGLPVDGRELLRLRHLAGARLVRERSDSPPSAAAWTNGHVPFGALPETDASELTAGLVRAAIRARGCLLVRGLIGRDDAGRLAAGVERAFDQLGRAHGGTPHDPDFFELFEALPSFTVTDIARAIVSDCCGLPVVDAPSPATELFDVLEAAGITRLVAEYLGDRPLISAQKTTLRRVGPLEHHGWHQDARAFGGDVHALNLWLPLTPCGETSPGLDIIPRRLEHLVTAGTEGTFLPGQVSDAQARAVAAGVSVVRPVFEPGDALLFDEWLLHSTSCGAEMRVPRLGLECWFFTSASFPPDYTPIAL